MHNHKARLLSDCISIKVWHCFVENKVRVSPPTVAVLFMAKTSAKISSYLLNDSVWTTFLHVYFDVLCCSCGAFILDAFSHVLTNQLPDYKSVLLQVHFKGIAASHV